jgi:hypothetical protein
VRLARRLEKRLERIVEGATAAVFRGRLHAVDVAGRLLREADFNAHDGDLGPEIPNRWFVRMSPADLGDPAAFDELSRELTRTLAEAAAERGWRTSGAVTVSVSTETGLRPGAVVLDADHAPGPGHVWGQLLDARGGTVLDLADNRMLVGRSGSADLTVDAPGVSRRHALIYRQGGQCWLVDLESSNGTSVNGAAAGREPTPLHPGDEVSFGPATFTFRLR